MLLKTCAYVQDYTVNIKYYKVASSNMSRFEAFRLIMKGIFGPYLPLPFGKKLIS